MATASETILGGPRKAEIRAQGQGVRLAGGTEGPREAVSLQELPLRHLAQTLPRLAAEEGADFSWGPAAASTSMSVPGPGGLWVQQRGEGRLLCGVGGSLEPLTGGRSTAPTALQSGGILAFPAGPGSDLSAHLCCLLCPSGTQEDVSSHVSPRGTTSGVLREQTVWAITLASLPVVNPASIPPHSQYFPIGNTPDTAIPPNGSSTVNA